MVTGGHTLFNSGGIGWSYDTEIFKNGQWKVVGKLPGITNVKVGTFHNKVLLTGNHNKA